MNEPRTDNKGEFSLRRLDARASRSRLLCNGQDRDRIVDGVALEAQFAIGAQTLLFTTDDCPFEEILHLYLLDERGERLDELHLGQPYTPGVLEHLTRLDERHFGFSFQSHAWSLTVHPRPRFMFGRPARRPIRRVGARWGRRWLELVHQS